MGILEQITKDGSEVDPKRCAYFAPELYRYISDNVSNFRKPETKIYVSYGSPLWCAWRKAQREAHKQTTRYQVYKVRQAFRILVKLCVRQWFKIRL